MRTDFIPSCLIGSSSSSVFLFRSQFSPKSVTFLRSSARSHDRSFMPRIFDRLLLMVFNLFTPPFFFPSASLPFFRFPLLPPCPYLYRMCLPCQLKPPLPFPFLPCLPFFLSSLPLSLPKSVSPMPIDAAPCPSLREFHMPTDATILCLYSVRKSLMPIDTDP